ncbi:hypothetical protein BGX38DRAFT_1281196 [Terfezia claveryi]|nr:hypothetical protein BGX38DRAFT_1281196 [Terfezia claveryi]
MAKHEYYDEDSYAHSTSSSHGVKAHKENKSATHVSSVHAPKASTFTIPCHHIRIGDLVILQHRPCQIIRITTSAQTGQHRYLGVDLFTSNSMRSHVLSLTHLHLLSSTPSWAQYSSRIEVVDQGNLWNKLREAFGKGSGAVRVLVISDHGKELAVDYKVVHLAHKL